MFTRNDKPDFELTDTDITARIRDSTTFGQIRELDDQLCRIGRFTIDKTHLRMHICLDPAGEKKAAEILSGCDLLYDIRVCTERRLFSHDVYREGMK